MNQIAKFIPLNPVEHENMLRTIILAHQGSTSGNPTQWVVDAVAEAFQKGFALGFKTGQMRMQPAPEPAYAVAFERPGLRERRAAEKATEVPPALPFVERDEP